MTDFSVSVFENKIGTRHRFLINKPQHPLRFINLICQNTIAQHHSESVSSARNKRRQILLRKTKQPGITLNQRNHLRYRNIFLFFRLFPVIQQSADALLQNQFLSMSYLKILKGNKSISIQSIVSNLLPFHPLSSFLSIFVFTAA